MPTVRFLLFEPYLPLNEKEKEAKKQGKEIRRKLNPKETRLYCYLILDLNHVVKIKTEHVVLPAQWDFDSQLKKERLAGSLEFNKKILALKEDVLQQYNAIMEEHPDIAFSQVAQALKDYGKNKEIPFLKRDKGLFQVLEDFISSKEGNVESGTIKKFNTLKKSLEEFVTINKTYAHLTFGQIDHSFKDAFIKYLRNQKPRGRQKTRPEGLQYGLLNDTIGKYIECLKTFLKWAEERKFNNNPTYKEFKNIDEANKKRKKRKNDIVTLTVQELKQLYNHEFETGSTLDRVRDLFCFGCYTGQRWGDIERFDKVELHGDVWNFVSNKTKEEITVDLIGYAAPAMDILKKYDYELPKISLTKFNLYIKNAAEAAKINTPTTLTRYVGPKEVKVTKPKYKWIGSHCARRTCVSILLNVYNLPVTAVLEITGHSDLKTLQKYINPDREARRKAIEKTKSITEVLTVVKEKAS